MSGAMQVGFSSMLGSNGSTCLIAAFIGTQDLGQKIMEALSESDMGKGLVLGLCVAFIGLIIDHLINKWAFSNI